MIAAQRDEAPGFADINVTPLVDVMLVLLVILMVCAPLFTETLRLDLPAAKGDAAAMHDDETIVSVGADGRVWLRGREITDDVEGALAAAGDVRSRIWLEAAADARHGDVARVIAAARAVGIGSVELMVDPQEGS